MSFGSSNVLLSPSAGPCFAAEQATMTGHRYVLASWLVLIGLVIPSTEVQVFIADAKFTVGRLALIAIIIPAIVVLVRRGRHLLACDIATGLMVVWMLTAASVNPGSLSSPAAVSMEFLFSYVAGRAFFVYPAALNTFIRVLKIMTIFVVAIAMAELMTGRLVAHETAAIIFGTSPPGAVFRQGLIRATSTLDHPILFGTFCALVNTILLFWEPTKGRRLLFSIICLIGCVASQSSAALMAYVLGTAAYSYEQLAQLPKRWTIFWSIFGCAIGAALLFSEHPIGWLISNLTLDPQSGYFRILIWNLAFERIEQSPLFGFSFQMFNDPILDTTVDCVWLVNALRFGIPASVLLFLVNVTAIWPIPRRKSGGYDIFGRRMGLAFTAVLLLFMFNGITVHFWNYMWIFWGLCVGIRGALRERVLNSEIAPQLKMYARPRQRIRGTTDLSRVPKYV